MDETYVDRSKCWLHGAVFNGQIGVQPEPELVCYPGGVRGHLFPAEGEQLKAFAARFDKGTIVNIGTLEGLSVGYMFLTCVKQKSKIYAIDMHYSPMFEVNLKFWGNDETNTVVYMNMLSHEAAKEFEDHSVDMIFVDGDHTGRGVLIDLVAWLPKMKPNGVVCGHDWENPEWPKVKPAVKRVFSGCPITVLPETVLWYVDLAALSPTCRETLFLRTKTFRDQTEMFAETKPE